MTSRAVAATRQVERWSAWQSVDSGRLLVIGAALVLVAAALVRATSGFTIRETSIAFGLFIAFGELLRLALPGGRQAAPIASTGALAYAMLLHVHTLGTGQPPVNIPRRRNSDLSSGCWAPCRTWPPAARPA